MTTEASQKEWHSQLVAGVELSEDSTEWSWVTPEAVTSRWTRRGFPIVVFAPAELLSRPRYESCIMPRSWSTLSHHIQQCKLWCQDINL